MRGFICPGGPAIPANVLNHTGMTGGAEKAVREKAILRLSKLHRIVSQQRL